MNALEAAPKPAIASWTPANVRLPAAPSWLRSTLVGVLLTWLPLPFALSFFAVYVAGLRAPAIGLYNDDGIYISTAKALADGHGYRIESTPGEIFQNKYPPLYPLVLAAVWKVFPHYPENAILLRLVSFVFLLGWLGAAWFFLVRCLSVPPNAANWILVIVAGTQACINAGVMAMSDTMFACLAMLALILARQAEVTGSTRAVIGALLLASAAYYTRTAAFVLFPAITLGLWCARRRRQAILFCALAPALLVWWSVWQHAHPAEHTSETGVYHTDANYRDSGVLTTTSYSAAERKSIVITNLAFLITAPARFFQIQRGLVFFPGIFLLCAWSWWSVAAGAIRKCTLCISALAFCALSVGMLMIWIWPPDRFMLPLVPILAGLAYHGIRSAFRPYVAGWIVLSLLSMVPLSLTFTAEKAAISFAPSSPDWNRIASVYQWIKSNLPRDAVIGSNYDGALYLETQRHAERFYAPPARPFYDLQPVPLAERTRAVRDSIHDWKMQYIVETGHDYWEDRQFFKVLEELRKESAIRLIHDDGPGYRVWIVE